MKMWPALRAASDLELIPGRVFDDVQIPARPGGALAFRIFLRKALPRGRILHEALPIIDDDTAI
jgi:hypothetical protein